MTAQALFEVMPTQEVKEKTLQTEYFNSVQRTQAEINGFIPVDPTAPTGIALKVVRELLI